MEPGLTPFLCGRMKADTMLKPHVIPDIEPTIDVGIILPEDDIRTVELTLPEQPLYRLIIKDTSIDLQPGAIRITYDHHTLHVTAGGMEWSGSGSITIEPVNPSAALAPRQGITMHPVVAGRGFHWQKNISVILPDTLRFSIYDNHLIAINSLLLEHYVMCVATSEMGADCPPALLEAQTIAARSWLLANIEQKHRAMGMDVCNDDCCQRYQGTTFVTPHSIAGTIATSGKVLMYGDTICDARYSKSCGGMMESAHHVWHDYHIPYMIVKPDTPPSVSPSIQKLDLTREAAARAWIDSVPDAWCGPRYVPENELSRYLGHVDEEAAYFRWRTEITQEEIRHSLKLYAGIQSRAVLSLLPVKRGGSGRITELDIVYYPDRGSRQQVYKACSEYEIRRILSNDFLYSSAFRVEYREISDRIPGVFLLIGAGWGHGAGLCQIGALGMALHGQPVEAILEHYYPNSYIKQIY